MGGMHGNGGGMCGRGACMPRFVHARWWVCQGVCMAGGMHGREACMVGGVHGRVGACMAGGMHGRRYGHCSVRYASYWNAFFKINSV